MAGHAWRQWATLFLLVVIVGILLGAAILSWRLPRRPAGPDIVAHRGGAATAPENTLAAARQAIADGFNWIEIDVHESRDGQVMVIHDKDLKRVAGRELVVWETDAKELNRIDVGSWFSPLFKDERVPTLGQLLDVCKDRIGVIIELKHFGHNQRLEERVAEIVKQHGMEKQVMAMSFDAESVRRLKALRPDWRVGWVTKERVADPRTIDADFLAIQHEQVTPEMMKLARRRRMPVFVWTVNDPKLVGALVDQGVDMIITDDPVMVRETLGKRPAAKR